MTKKGIADNLSHGNKGSTLEPPAVTFWIIIYHNARYGSMFRLSYR